MLKKDILLQITILKLQQVYYNIYSGKLSLFLMNGGS